MFDKLVLNAFDFIHRALTVIESDPKISVIFFWTGLELFVKARLLKEHWSLILTDPKKADLAKFKKGDFHSVSFTTAMNRLQKVSGSKVAAAKDRCFGILRDHRNKLVHFFSDDYSSQDNKTEVQKAVIEQFRAWYYLHVWLTHIWRQEFSGYTTRIEETHELISQNRKFLQAKHDGLAPVLKEILDHGSFVAECRACLFVSALESQRIKHPDLEVIAHKCLVCDHIRLLLRAKCPHCQSSIEIEELGERPCYSCEKNIDLADLIRNIGPAMVAKDDLMEPSLAYCSDCEHSWEPSVVRLKDGNLLCLSCITIHDQVSECEYCGERITGDAIGTHWEGCVVCQGRDMPD